MPKYGRSIYIISYYRIYSLIIQCQISIIKLPALRAGLAINT